MGKKNKDGKKSKSGKKKDFSEVGTLDLGQAITQTARTMRTALSHGLADSGLYAGQDGVVLILAEDDGLTLKPTGATDLDVLENDIGKDFRQI